MQSGCEEACIAMILIFLSKRGEWTADDDALPDAATLRDLEETFISLLPCMTGEGIWMLLRQRFLSTDFEKKRLF
jgi:hypothetical protein